jgi:hypothetical protein
MDKIRILFNGDKTHLTYAGLLDEKTFTIDERTIETIGQDTSADILTDYDAIIFNFIIPIYFHEERISQLLNFLAKENKILIVFLNRHAESNNKANTQLIGNLIQRFGGTPDSFINTIAAGSKYELTVSAKKNIMYDYIKNSNQKWMISFYNVYDYVIPLAFNTENNIVAFSLSKNNVMTANAFLPINPNGNEIFWKSISDYLLNKNSNFKEIEDWVSNISFPKLDNLNNLIKEKQDGIRKLELEKSNLELEKVKYERIRNVLMYYDGDLLCDVCMEVMKEMGIDVLYGKHLREDLVFVYGNEHFVIEVKGAEKSATKTHIRQLNSHTTEYANENEVLAKGILIINAWRKLPIEERNTADKPIFPNEIMNLVNISKISLITSQQLFVAYCKNLEGNFRLEEFMGKISHSNGQLEGYDNYDEYRMM